jgi:hypothetical protein
MPRKSKAHERCGPADDWGGLRNAASRPITLYVRNGDLTGLAVEPKRWALVEQE